MMDIPLTNYWRNGGCIDPEKHEGPIGKYDRVNLRINSLTKERFFAKAESVGLSLSGLMDGLIDFSLDLPDHELKRILQGQEPR